MASVFASSFASTSIFALLLSFLVLYIYQPFNHSPSEMTVENVTSQQVSDLD